MVGVAIAFWQRWKDWGVDEGTLDVYAARAALAAEFDPNRVW